MPYTRRNPLQSHVGHSDLLQTGTSLDKIKRQIRHGVPRDVENDDIVCVKMEEDWYRLKISTCDIDKFE